MSANVCPDRQQLEAYTSGRLSLDRADWLADHLDACTRCETAIEELERGADRLLMRLRLPSPPDPLHQEPQCRQMLELLRDPTLGATLLTSMAQSPGPTPTMPGNFRDYRLLEKLGEGGMGAVYKALHTKLNRLVAIKLLFPGLAQDPQRVARFEREMSAVGKLDHPHIVRATDAGVAEGHHFLVMEYVDGLNLSEVIGRTGPLRIPDACEVVRQAALGLRCADEHALIHRDIKPSNLMLTADGQVKILDLGLALFEAECSQGEETTAFGQVMGTAEYIAPEQVSDAHSVDIRADIYSLGCTFYKLLTGQAPFAGPGYRGSVEKMTAQLRDPVPPVRSLRADVPEKLAAVLERMLAKDRDLRIPTPGRLIADIEPFCAGSDLAGLFGLARKSPAAKPDVNTPATASRVETPPALPGATGHTAPIARPPTAKPAPGSPPRGKPMAAASSKDAKQPAFDPYYRWLGISPKDQPPNHYRLLGIDLFEPDLEVIRDAVEQRMAHVRTYQLGAYSAISQRILNELGAAKAALLDPARKAAYDVRLRQQLQARTAPPPVPDRKAPAAPLPEKPAEIEKINAGVETLFAEIERHHAPQPSRPRRKRLSAGWWKRPPGKHIAIAAASAAAMLLAGIIFYVTTNSGTVKIELADANANVEVRVDGNTIDISGLKQPLRLRAGEHDLHVTSTEFETYAKKFTVRRGQEDVVRVSLEPRSKGPQATGREPTPPIVTTTEVPQPKPAILLVTVDPTDAKLVPLDAGVTAERNGARYKVTVPSPDPMTPITLELTREGHYRNLYKVRPRSGEVIELTAVTSGLPADFDKSLPPPTREYWWGGQGEKVPGTVPASGAKEAVGSAVSLAGDVGEVRRYPKGYIHRVAFSPGGKSAWTAEFDGQLRRWNLDTGEDQIQIQDDKELWTMDVSPGDARWILSGGGNRILRLWDAQSGREIRRFEGHTDAVTSGAFSSDGSRILSGSWDRTIRLWDARTAKQLNSYRGSPPAVFAPSGREAIWVCADDNKTFCLFDLVNNKEVRRFTGQGAIYPAHLGLAISPDGRWAVSGSMDHTARIWDLQTGREMHCLRGHQDWVIAVAISPDSRRVLTMGFDADKTVRLWEVETGREIHCFQGHPHGLHSGDFSPDGRFALTCGHDYTTILWRLPEPAAEVTTAPNPFGVSAGQPSSAVAPFDQQTAKQHQQAWAKHLGVPVETTNSIGMKLVLIPPGMFMMGSPDPATPPDEQPQHRVRITRPFLLGKCEATKGEYERVMGISTSQVQGNEKNWPVDKVSWENAEEFCRKLSELLAERMAGRKYRLPTEAEWEYACRAGGTGNFGRDDDAQSLGKYAWFRETVIEKAHPVGEKKPNAWTLHDMLGNVREWCADWYGDGYYRQSFAEDPIGPSSGSDHVLRGGSVFYPAFSCRPAHRDHLPSMIAGYESGFRVVCELKKTD